MQKHPHPAYRLVLPTAAVLLALSASGCAAQGSTATPAAAPSTANAKVKAASGIPSWNGPSDAAHLICTVDAKEEISGALGLTLTQPLAPTWTDRLYACAYHYPNGTLQLSVKDLPDAAATTAWFQARRGTARSTTPLIGMGDAAFQEPDGTVIVRKDTTVLVVDVSALPSRVGVPPRERAVAARTVATTILICWKEA
ncbi:hypothetical protein C8250_034325 [Streptomyces sp. So13.3]|uniref:putative collagen-binding domain-containing protein n=1 Tax=Streptomyces TaxID=1883 RepID=UPI0011071577|nr:MULTISPECIES: putative collagen-binding domain-containing protein [unclassified Streptomyces]MCZ4098715.1 hypothetical protein [Streptomyces sp. H39-C1]QNA76276.1 hypothetical protein C8250_034325 [Streptomyces sp. So13.3]